MSQSRFDDFFERATGVGPYPYQRRLAGEDSGRLCASLRIHVPTGCAPAPLASYLKGLAFLRLVAEQRDSGARGWWADDIFHLD